MLIRTKLRAGSILLVLIPAIITSSLIGWYSLKSAEQALHGEAQSKLISLRENRATQILDYFKVMHDQAIVYAKNQMTIDAMKQLSESYNVLDGELSGDIESARTDLRNYYIDTFSAEYQKHNTGKKIDVNQLFDKLSPTAIQLQLRFIKNNPYPLGNKDQLIQSSDDSSYSKAHALYHPTFRALQQRFGYYDIFLIESDSGNVVYSNFKELDFASSLTKGPFSQSGLAEAYRGAMKLGDDGSVFMTDFSPYKASYDDPAAFVATPIFDHGKRIGVIAFQLPIDRINNVMTSNGKWKDQGFGDSGETYLVGSDFTMRSQSRFWIEDSSGFLAAIQTAGESPDTIKMIETKNTVIGLQHVRSEGAERAIGGESGFATFDDYRGVPVLSAFKPIEIGGHRWAVLAEEDAAESYAAANQLHEEVIYMIAGAGLVLLIISGVIGWLFSESLARPLGHIVNSMEDISSGSGDLTVRLDDSAKDELGQIAKAFNQFVKKLDQIMNQVAGSTNELATASEEMSVVTRDIRQGVSQQQSEIEQVATAIEEMTATVKDVAHNTNATADAARHAGTQVNDGKSILERSASAIQELLERMNQSKEVVNALQQDSNRVGDVLDVIRSVAEQTNLLALNAAIEAARAGEQGRGFAVVADEVRVLAQRTQESTEEIRDIVETLQSRSEQAVNMIQTNNEDLGATADLSQQTQNAFLEIEGAMQQLLDMSAQIASATEEQAATTEEISRNVDGIYQVAQSTAAGAEQTAVSSEMLARLGDDLKGLVGQFKLSKG